MQMCLFFGVKHLNWLKHPETERDIIAFVVELSHELHLESQLTRLQMERRLNLYAQLVIAWGKKQLLKVQDPYEYNF